MRNKKKFYFYSKEGGLFFEMLKPNEYGGLNCNDRYLTTASVDNIIQALSDEDKVKVEVLFLYNNRIDTVPESILLLPNLKQLWLDGNQIAHLPEWIGNLTYLETLTVMENNLQSLPYSIGNLTSLKRLALHKNYLKALPASMQKLTNLITISLTLNVRLPQHLQVKNFNHETQKTLFEIALEERRVNARDVTAAWMLGAPQIPVHRDVRNLLSQMIYATRGDEVWENATTNPE